MVPAAAPVATPATTPFFETGELDESIDPLLSELVVEEVAVVSKPVSGILLSIKEANLASVASELRYNLELVSSTSSCKEDTASIGK